MWEGREGAVGPRLRFDCRGREGGGGEGRGRGGVARAAESGWGR